jgi:hypothetical protein
MPPRPLRFIHITKTAGTAIEHAGKELGMKWGAADKDLQKEIMQRTRKDPSFPFHHHPWGDLPEAIVSEWLREADWFAVVRDPVDRVRSECFCRFGNHTANRKPENMNRVIRRFLILLIRGKAEQLPAGPGHWLPQSLFTHRGGRRVVRHILSFRQLEAEWWLLLKAHGLPEISLPHKRPGNVERPEVLPKVDLLNRLLIRWVYRDDYRLLKRHWSRRQPALDDFPIPTDSA